MNDRKISPVEQFLLRGEDIIMTRLVPKERPGFLFKWLFKIPVFFYKIGLPLFGKYILLLTTTGRKSGRKRHTPLEYRLEKSTGNIVSYGGMGRQYRLEAQFGCEPARLDPGGPEEI